MKIIIKGASFKDNNLESTTISKYYSVTYSGDGVSSSSSPRTIAYGEDGYATQDLVATIKVLSSYTFNSVTSVSVGGKALSTSDYTVSGQTVTVPANKVNGNVVIAFSATAVNTGDENQPIYPEGTNVKSVMPQDTGYVSSTNGQVMEYSGYNWAEYDIYCSCRYGTTSAMYAACVWGPNDEYLGGIWKSTGTAEIFTERLLAEADLPTGVTWDKVEKIGLSWSTGKNTPAMKLVEKN